MGLSLLFSDSEGPRSSKNKTKKRKLTKQKPLKDNKAAKRSKSGGDVKAVNSKTVNSVSGPEVLLPPEILLKIFQMVVAEEGALPFLNRYSKNAQCHKKTCLQCF